MCISFYGSGSVLLILYKKNPSSSGENKTIVSQVLKDMSEMTSKMRFLDLCRTHLQVGERAPKGNFNAPKPSPEQGGAGLGGGGALWLSCWYVGCYEYSTPTVLFLL